MSETTATHPFIDIAAWHGVREKFLAGSAIALFDAELDRILWANGPAARLFGYETISDFQTAGLAGTGAVRRQLQAAAARTTSEAGTRTMLRIAAGLTSRLLATDIERVRDETGEECVIVALQPTEKTDEGDAAGQAILGLDAEGAGAAILDDHGRDIARNDMFAEVAVPFETIRRLIDEAGQESPRPLKRRVAAEGGGSAVVAVARLSEAPARFLVMAVPSAVGAGGTAVPEADDDPVAEEGEPGISAPPDNVTHEPEEPAPSPLVSAEEDARAIEPEQPGLEEPEFVADLDAHTRPIRFVWRTDQDGRFVDISPEFAAAVGPRAADVVGRTFEEVANALGLDPSGEINASLKRRDTWSGKSVAWPVQGTAHTVPVDLAALPSYGRDRTFEGYRGFGVARMAEASPDPDETGLSLVALTPAIADDHEQAVAETPAAGEAPEETAVPDTPEADDPFAGETPALSSVAPTPLRRAADKVIDLEAKRRGQSGHETLSPGEQAAFRRIGETLGWARPDAGEDETGEHGHSGDVAEVPVEAEPAIADSETEAGTPESGEAPHLEPTAADTSLEDDLAGTGELFAGREEPFRLREVAFEPREETEDIADAPREAELPPPPPVDEPAFHKERDTAPDAGVAREYLPSAFAGAAIRPESGSLSETFFDELPIAVLLHRGEEALFVNRAFAALTGYGDAGELNEAGGIDGLFAGEVGADGVLSLSCADDRTISARAHMQTVPWHGRTAIMFAFEPSAPAPAEPAIAESDSSEADELRAILDTATDGVVVLSSDGVIRSLNGSASALFGYSSEDVEGKSFTMLFAHESQPAALNYVHGLAHNGVASVLNEGLEVLGREKHGGFLPLFMTIGRLETSSRLCAVVRDITAWKQTEQALLDAQRSAESASTHKTEFLAKISHEIRTPLNAIIGFSELMAEERFGPIGNDRYKSYLADINKSGKYVLDLVNDLLDISKIEAGKQELEFESVSLNEAIADAVAMVQPQANRNRIIVRSSLDDRLPAVVADSRSMKQIVLNLLSNSVRFTHSGGQVIVNTSYNAKGEVVLRIKDTGIGMSTKEIETALQPFQQVASLGRVRGDGTGLGLPLTKALVEANRAEFAIQSEPGRGTTVEIVFPSSRVLAS